MNRSATVASSKSERVSEHCDALERQITETAAALAELNGRIDVAETPEQRLQIMSQIEFSTPRWRELIEERIQLEEHRLAEVALDAEHAARRANPVAPLVDNKKALEIQILDLESKIHWAQVESKNLRNKTVAAQNLANLFHSRNSVDQGQLKILLNELRLRLETLGLP